MKKAIALIALLSGSAFAQVQLGRNVQIGAGGTGGCIPSVPANAVLFSPSGTDCAGSSKFTFHPDVSTGQVLINQGAFLEIDGVDSSNFAFLNGDQFILTNHGESNVQTGVAVHVDESAYTGTGLGPLAFDAIFEVDKAGHFGTGFLTEPSIGSVAANTIIGYQSGAPSTSGGTVGKFYGFHAAGAGINATTEEFSFFAKTAPNASVNSNYCDFMARTQEGSPVLRAKIGCGPTAASMFGGAVTVPDLTVTGTCTGCGGGTPGGSTTQIQYNNAGAFGGDSGFTTDGAGHETMKSLAVADGTGVAGFVGIKQGTAASTVANSIGFTAPASVTAYNVKLPGTQGTGALTNDGAGNLSWTAAGGTPGGSNTQIQFNDSGAFGGNANFTWTTGTGLALPLDTVSAINAGSGTPDPYTTWNFANVMTTTPYPASTYRESTYFAAIPTLGADDANVHWSAMNGFTFPGDDHNYHDIFGGQLQALTTHAGNIFEMDGGAFGAFHEGAGLINLQIGGKVSSVAQSTGSITTNYGVQVSTGNQGTGTIATNYGIDIPSTAGSGAITTNYGLHIGAQTGGATNYNLYSAGATTHNKFEGDVTANGIVDSALTPGTSPICPNGTGGALTTAGCTGGAAPTVASSETVASSATPTFSTSFNVSYNVLTANVTSFTLAAGSDGQSKTLTFCQNGTGGFTVAPPANVHGFFTVSPTASKCNSQHFNYSTAQTAWLADSAGVIGE